MDMDVSIGESLGVLTEAPPHPAGLQAREEYAKVMSDPTHPHYEGLRRRDPKAEAYVNSLYSKAYGVPETKPPGTPTDPAPLREHDHDLAMTLEDRAAQTEVETLLRNTLGDGYDSDMRDMRIGAQHLFSTPDGEKMLTAISSLITDLGPLAEVRGVRFLAELGQLVKRHKAI